MGETPKTALAHLFPKPNSSLKSKTRAVLGVQWLYIMDEQNDRQISERHLSRCRHRDRYLKKYAK